MEVIAALEKLEIPEDADVPEPFPFVLAAAGELGDVVVTPR